MNLLPSYFFRCEGAYHKIDAIAKGHSIRQVLTGSVFLNFHHLHPEFQKFILIRIQKHYTSKKDIQSDVTFFLVMSVSVLSFPILTASRCIDVCSFIKFFYVLATLVVHYVCFLGGWHWMPY